MDPASRSDVMSQDWSSKARLGRASKCAGLVVLWVSIALGASACDWMTIPRGDGWGGGELSGLERRPWRVGEGGSRVTLTNVGFTEVEEMFISEALASSHLQVDLARMAGKRAQDEPVKALAARLRADNERMIHDLPFPSVIGKEVFTTRRFDEHNARRRELLGLEGAAFDRAYLEAVATTLREQSEDCDAIAPVADGSLKVFAARACPTLTAEREALTALRSPGA